MKVLLVISAVVAVAAAQYNYQPANPSNGNGNGPSSTYGVPEQTNGNGNGYEPEPAATEAPQPAARAPQIYRHIYVHSAPEEAVERQSRIIRVPGNQDKHVNIIFVKTPTNDFQQQTEVILPEQGEQKTLVYVLSKKGESNSELKIRGPAPTQPSKPEVYFIRYKNDDVEETKEAEPTVPAPAYGVPNRAPGQPQAQAAPSFSLNAPSANAQPIRGGYQ